MFLFHPIHFLKFLVKSQPPCSYKKGSYTKKKSVFDRRKYIFCAAHVARAVEIVYNLEFAQQ